jgi:Fanconi anemia group M protein
MLFLIAQREEGDRGARKLHPRKSYRSGTEEIEYVISAFPGVGLKSAHLLLERFGSIQGIANATEEEIRSVKGIGEKTAHRIAELVRRRYR